MADSNSIKYEIEIHPFDLAGYLSVNIFGKKFVKNNKDKCKMEINGTILDLKHKYTINLNESSNNIKLQIKLLGINNINQIFARYL